ncbi:MAG: homoserine kinase [Candidatus Schekmanbacteria bacterium]|nr:homoserine kinase [Candidatus Schekmanbacteria bacterium]
MVEARRVRVEVPATTGNLGPAFDVLGMAVELRNVMIVEEAAPGARPIMVVARGYSADELTINAERFLGRVVEALEDVAHVRVPPLLFEMDNRIPLRRGLGSSAAAIVGTLAALRYLFAPELDDLTMLRAAHRVEGHPDQVVPALVGGLTASILDGSGSPMFVRFAPPPLQLLVVVPDREVATTAARKVLPESIGFAVAVHNIGRTALLLAALLQTPGGSNSDLALGGADDWSNMLRTALDDRMHEPFRDELNPGYRKARKAALDTGAAGVFLSGSGPTTIVVLPPFTPPDSPLRTAIADAMIVAFRKAGVAVSILNTVPAAEGVRVSLASPRSAGGDN